MGLRTEALMMWGLVWLCVSKCHSIPAQHCDSGKVKLEVDLPAPHEFLCLKPGVSAPAQLLDVSTKYSPQPAEHVCMNLPIRYNQTIPNSGAHRPVGAQSGEYLYCPPQRWIKNLKDGATVLLFHPCAPEDARSSLAAVAHSCLPHFILTAHPQLSQRRPFALVSWGHTLEMSRITAAAVCDWLLTFASEFNPTTASQNYTLYLTKAAPADRVPDSSAKTLKACCAEALAASDATATARKSRAVLHPAKGEGISSKTDELNSEHTQPLNNNKDNDGLSLRPQGLVTAPVHLEEHAGGAGVGTNGTQSLNEPHGSRSDDVRVVKLHDVKKSSTVAAGRRRVNTDAVEPGTGGDCASPGRCRAPGVATAVIGGPPRGRKRTVQRTDEAVWAAAALGFILVLLTLSVLHTRLYRNCRPPSSLYWRESQRDYESVADIIRRRLRMVGRRKRKVSQSRRQECPLLPDSSTDDD